MRTPEQVFFVFLFLLCGGGDKTEQDKTDDRSSEIAPRGQQSRKLPRSPSLAPARNGKRARGDVTGESGIGLSMAGVALAVAVHLLRMSGQHDTPEQVLSGSDGKFGEKGMVMIRPIV